MAFFPWRSATIKARIVRAFLYIHIAFSPFLFTLGTYIRFYRRQLTPTGCTGIYPFGVPRGNGPLLCFKTFYFGFHLCVILFFKHYRHLEQEKGKWLRILYQALYQRRGGESTIGFQEIRIPAVDTGIAKRLLLPRRLTGYAGEAPRTRHAPQYGAR